MLSPAERERNIFRLAWSRPGSLSNPPRETLTPPTNSSASTRNSSDTRSTARDHRTPSPIATEHPTRCSHSSRASDRPEICRADQSESPARNAHSGPRATYFRAQHRGRYVASNISPCTRLSRARTTTRAPPPTQAISGLRLACTLKGTSATPVGFPRSLPFACPGRRPALPLRLCHDAHADTRRDSFPARSSAGRDESPVAPGTRSPLDPAHIHRV